MKHYILRLVCLLSAMTVTAILFPSCEEEHFVNEDKFSGNTEDPILLLSAVDDKVFVKREDSQARITVTSNTSWTVECDQEWCDVSPISAFGDGTIVITVPEKYTSIGGRDAKITVKATDEVYKVITVTQQGARLVDILEIQAGKPHSEYLMPINGLGSWTAEVLGDDAEWCTLYQGSGENYFENKIQVESNMTDQERRAIVKITCGNEEETVTVIQSGIFPQPEAVLKDENKTFSLSWPTIQGASHYVIIATPENGQPSEIMLAPEYGFGGEEVENYVYDLKKLYADVGNQIASMQLSVMAISEDPEISSVSNETFDVHTLFAQGSGDGSDANNAYLIASPRHLDNIRITGNTYKYYQQTTDIDLSGYDSDDDETNGNFTTIPQFTGVYTGKTNLGGMSKISNLKIVNPNTVKDDLQAIFGMIVGTEESSISYVESVNPVIELTGSGTSIFPCPSSPFVGTTDGIAPLLIEHCKTSGNGYIKASIICQQLGGIIGKSNANVIIRHCSNTIPIEGRNLGGIAGVCGGGVIEHCFNTADITGDKYAGGIAGSQSGGSTIRYCYNTGHITCLNDATADDITAAGIAGRIEKSAPGGCRIEACYNTGKIEAKGVKNSNIGGITGLIADVNAVVTNCYNTGDLVAAGATAKGGGIVSYFKDNTTGTISFCYNIGTISTLSTKGGILGLYNKSGIKVNNSYFLEAEGLTGIGNDPDGTGIAISKTKNELEMWETYSGWDTAIWEISATSTYKLPQLIGLPHVE